MNSKIFIVIMLIISVVASSLLTSFIQYRNIENIKKQAFLEGMNEILRTDNENLLVQFSDLFSSLEVDILNLKNDMNEVIGNLNEKIKVFNSEFNNLDNAMHTLYDIFTSGDNGE